MLQRVGEWSCGKPHALRIGVVMVTPQILVGAAFIALVGLWTLLSR